MSVIGSHRREPIVVTPQEILSHPPRVLTQEQRQAYFDQGFVVCRGLLDGPWLLRMQDAYTRAVERSRGVAGSNTWFSLQRHHTAECPRIQRIEKRPDQDPEFWQVVIQSRVAAADVLGPDVKYRDSMINVKAPGEGGGVSWDQDLPFYPHANTGTIQVREHRALEHCPTSKVLGTSCSSWSVTGKSSVIHALTRSSIGGSNSLLTDRLSGLPWLTTYGMHNAPPF